jgi:hypothetical protein
MAAGNAPKTLQINNEISKTVSGKYKARCQKSNTPETRKIFKGHYPIKTFQAYFYYWEVISICHEFTF